MCAVRKISPPRNEPTIPMTMSPATPKPPPTAADASQPATSPTTNQIRMVSPLMISSERANMGTSGRRGKPLDVDELPTPSTRGVSSKRRGGPPRAHAERQHHDQNAPL